MPQRLPPRRSIIREGDEDGGGGNGVNDHLALSTMAQSSYKSLPAVTSATNMTTLDNEGLEMHARRIRVDRLVARFHIDRKQLCGSNHTRDVAVVFAAPGTLLDIHLLTAFRNAPSERPFAPFDVVGVPRQDVYVANQNSFVSHCYVLRAINHRANENCDDYDPYYCIGGCPQRAVRHYRIDFDALLRLLFYHRYRYILKPIIVDHCLATSQTL